MGSMALARSNRAAGIELTVTVHRNIDIVAQGGAEIVEARSQFPEVRPVEGLGKRHLRTDTDP